MIKRAVLREDSNGEENLSHHQRLHSPDRQVADLEGNAKGPKADANAVLVHECLKFTVKGSCDSHQPK